jgi:anti-sigma factor RsiW
MNLERLNELIDAWRDGMLTEEAASELSQLLRDCDEARRIFRAESQMHGLLHQAVTAAVVEETAGLASCPAHPAASGRLEKSVRWKARITSRKLRFAGASALALAALSAFLWISLSRQPNPRPPKPAESFATLTHAAGCLWEGPTRPQAGDRLAAGVLNLRKGTAEVKLSSGVDLLVEAPASVELVDTGNCVLTAGRIVARVPPAATGYVVDTPKAKFVDQGTEFGVSVEPERETIAQVFDGIVVAELKNSDPSGKRSRRLVAGETVRIDASNGIELQKVAFSYEYFLRTFSTPSVYQGEELIPFKPSRMSSLDIVAAPGRVTIDGDLSDWDLSGVFEARCAEPFAESYFVDGSMMYDEQQLYVAAEVGDPMPMRNVIGPNIDPWSAWMGGSVQLRLSTDRTFGWPLKAKRPTFRGEASVQDTSDRVVHLTLWYFQPREQPCLEIRYGMNLDHGVVNPPGWRGAFRKAPDGKSYIVECAIPWSLLGAGHDPPRAGDELGLCWTVNWSDASGKRWKGQLIEIKNPPYAARGKKALTFMYAETWGKGIYK